LLNLRGKSFFPEIYPIMPSKVSRKGGDLMKLRRVIFKKWESVASPNVFLDQSNRLWEELLDDEVLYRCELCNAARAKWGWRVPDQETVRFVCSSCVKSM
jgi:hypothetical protein